MYVGLQYHLQNNDMVFILVINMQGVGGCSIHSTKDEMTQCNKNKAFIGWITLTYVIISKQDITYMSIILDVHDLKKRRFSTSRYES
jgi:hypothetical protein